MFLTLKRLSTHITGYYKCLVPEVPVVLEGEKGCLPHLMRRVKQQGYAVVVVAEGAGEEVLGTSTEVDASGNKKLPKIGEFMKKSIEDYFKKHGETATVKYIDPSYTVRTVPANAADSLYCMQLAQNAVHGAMVRNFQEVENVCLVLNISQSNFSPLSPSCPSLGWLYRFFCRSMQQSNGFPSDSRACCYESSINECPWSHMGTCHWTNSSAQHSARTRRRHRRSQKRPAYASLSYL